MTAGDTRYLIETVKAATPWHVFLTQMGLADKLMVLAALARLAVSHRGQPAQKSPGRKPRAFVFSH